MDELKTWRFRSYNTGDKGWDNTLVVASSFMEACRLFYASAECEKFEVEPYGDADVIVERA